MINFQKEDPECKFYSVRNNLVYNQRFLQTRDQSQNIGLQL